MNAACPPSCEKAMIELATDRTDPERKALSCYGLLRDDTGGMLLRFVRGRPVSQVTEDYLAWLCERLAAEGKKALLLVWDNASWHISKRVRAWLKAHVKDNRSRRGLLKLVSTRRSLLDYIKKKDEARYKALLEKHNIRR